MNKFGENLKNIRKANNLNQKQFARLMNTTQQRISEWECGKVEPSVYHIIKIMQVLNTKFEDLADGLIEQ